MSPARVVVHEAWRELQFGLRSGVVSLTFVGLVGYVLLVLTNAGYLQDLGAVDVPRNAPNLVYLMTTGDVFFLFFAWAWVFAQPIVRDRSAMLHEVVLTAPVPITALLGGRYLGALAVGLLLGTSQMVAFLLVPLLETLGLAPPGSVGPTPWAAFVRAWLLFLLPSAAGTGALYFLAALRSGSTVGPFAASAVLIGIWMFAMIVLTEGGILVSVAAVIDPSAFAEVDRLNKLWTPLEKASVLYPLTLPLVLNRLLWGVLPVLVLAIVLTRITREFLVVERTKRARKCIQPAAIARTGARSEPQAPASATPYHSWRAFLQETGWQHRMLLSGRTLVVLVGAMILLATAAGFVHLINHADGPFQARPELATPMLNRSLYLVLAFIAAALVGHVLRRDQRAGIVEMLDAAPAPSWVSLFARLAAVGTITLCLLMTPAVASILLALLNVPESLSLLTPVLYQAVVYGPGLLELVAVSVLLHCLIRRSGPAYAASMLATFILVVNHEADLVTYPPLEFGIPAHLDFSVLTGWMSWACRLFWGDVFKLLVVFCILAAAAGVGIRGLDSRLSRGAAALRRRFFGPPGAALVTGLAAAAAVYPVLESGFVEQGGYRTRAEELAEHADWERRWLGTAAAWTTAGGALTLAIDTAQRVAIGDWRLEGVRSDSGLLHFELPDWLRIESVSVNGAPARIDQTDEHAAVTLGACAESGCVVALRYAVRPQGWNAKGEQLWLGTEGVWAQAKQLVPALGLDLGKRVMAPRDRASVGLPVAIPQLETQAVSAAIGVAPAAPWQVAISIDGVKVLDDRIEHALDFVVYAAHRAQATRVNGLVVWADSTRGAQAAAVADDAATMHACVARRSGAAPRLTAIGQLPRGGGRSALANGTLLLAEEPYWDVGETGAGRWRRQAELAMVIARAALLERVDLRQGEGAQAFLSGASGALGYLCAGDANGTAALQTLLTRGADRISQGLGGSATPVLAVINDTSEPWLDEYVAAAYIPWIAQVPAARFDALLTELRGDRQVAPALRQWFGERAASDMLGMPLSVDLSTGTAEPGSEGPPPMSVAAFAWSGGGWTEARATPASLALHRQAQGLTALASGGDVPLVEVPDDALLLADWPAYERTPADNVVEPQCGPAADQRQEVRDVCAR